MASPGISPSRANDFRQCPLLFRFRTIDKLAEPYSEAAVRGTLVHAVLEWLFTLPAGERSATTATAGITPCWQKLVTTDESAAELDAAMSTHTVDRGRFLAAAAELVRQYFSLEDPNRYEPAGREQFVSYELDSGLIMRGFIDRLDVAPDGRIRIVDYKTGKAPLPQYSGTAKFQMLFYAALVRGQRQVTPALVQLMYLGNGQVVRYTPTDEQLDDLIAQVEALWREIQRAGRAGYFTPRTSRLCSWCSFQQFCPAFDGVLPELDPEAVHQALGVRPAPA